MPRNYSKEAHWAKQKYKCFGIKIDRKLGEKLIEVLKANGIEQAAWFKTVVSETISKYSTQNKESLEVEDKELI